MRAALHVALLALATLAPVTLEAQGARRGGPRWEPHLGLHAGKPHGVSAALGIMRVAWRNGDFTAMGGPRLVVEPGLRAATVRLGYARTGAFAAGYAVEAAVLRQWGRDGAEHLPRTMFGAELHGSMMFIDLGAGLYRSSDGAKQVRVSAGLVL